EERPWEAVLGPVHLGQPVPAVQVGADGEGDPQREEEEEHGDVGGRQRGVADGRLRPVAVLVGPEAGHDVEDHAGGPDQAPEDRDAADLLAVGHRLGDQRAAAPYQASPPPQRGPRHADHLGDEQAAVVLVEPGAGGVGPVRPGGELLEDADRCRQEQEGGGAHDAGPPSSPPVDGSTPGTIGWLLYLGWWSCYLRHALTSGSARPAWPPSALGGNPGVPRPFVPPPPRAGRGVGELREHRWGHLARAPSVKVEGSE